MNSLNFDPETLSLELATSNGNNWILNPPIQQKMNQLITKYRIETTFLCNLSCEYCIIFKNNVTSKITNMSLEVINKLISQFNQEVNKNGTLYLFGAEPLLNWNVIKYAVENCLGRKVIFTNGLLLSENKIKLFKENEVTIMISLDGYKPEHNVYRFKNKSKELLKDILKKIELLKRNNCNFILCSLVNKYNIEDLYSITSYFFNNLAIENYSFSYPHYTLVNSETNNFDISKYTNQICGLLELTKKEKIYIHQLADVLHTLLTRQPKHYSCGVGTCQRTFYPDGSETVCTKLDQIPCFSIKTFLEKTLPDNNLNCSHCSARKICGGGCPFDAAIHPNKIGVDSRICFYKKELLMFILKDMEKELSDTTELEIKSKMENYLEISHTNWDKLC